MRQAKIAQKRAKIVFIIPGFRQQTGSKSYKEVARLLRLEGYRTISIAIPWSQTTIADNTSFFLETIQKKLTHIKSEKSHVYFLGFSYGALIALLAATKFSVKGLMLCSLSPFFKEDLPKKLPKSATALQLKRFRNFTMLKSVPIAKKVKAKRVMMLYGAKESKPLIARVTKTFRHIPTTGKYLFAIKNTDHMIGDKKYLSAIHYITKSFL